MKLARNKDFSKNLYTLKVIKNEEEYQEALKSLEAVFDKTEGIGGLSETLTLLIEKYEFPSFLPKASGIEVLKFLMDQNGLKQRIRRYLKRQIHRFRITKREKTI